MKLCNASYEEGRDHIFVQIIFYTLLVFVANYIWQIRLANTFGKSPKKRKTLERAGTANVNNDSDDSDTHELL